MTNQEQYELICEKADKYDRLVGVVDKIKADYNMTILHDLYYNEALNQEYKDAINYAISCIKTLQDMGEIL